MGDRTYSLAAGVALLCAAVVFLTLPELLDYDAFFPFLFALIAFVSSITILVLGLAKDR